MGLFGKSRGEKKAANKLGYITEKMSSASNGKIHSEITGVTTLSPGAPIESGAKPIKHREYRSAHLKNIMAYFDDTAYDHLQDWHKANAEEEYVPIRKRKPFMRYNLPKILATRVASKLVGRSVFPTIAIQDDPEAEYYFRQIVKSSGLDHKLVGPTRGLVARGSMFVRFHIVAGKFKIECFDSNMCYPEFAPDDTLISVMVCRTYIDHDDLDQRGNPRKKWYKAEFGQNVDILYDNPEWKPGVEPQFMEMERVEHGFGFVQGEWFRTDEQDFATPDGMSLVEDAISFQDAINYSLSQSQMATDYNTDPQLALRNMDEEDIENLIRSSQKAWNLGREGEGMFLESSMNGVSASMELRDKNRTMIQDLTRVILMDPEKMTATAQSGKAMEVLHGPFVDLINELRPQLENHMTMLIIKMGVANIISAAVSGASPVPVPPGWMPGSDAITFNWPPVFELTVQDLAAHTQWVANATNNNLISRRTGTTMVAKYFNILDVDAEIEEINTQPQLNPFGMF